MAVLVSEDISFLTATYSLSLSRERHSPNLFIVFLSTTHARPSLKHS